MSQLDGTAIQQIQDLTINGHFLSELSKLDSQVAVLPSGYSIQALEKYNENRFRFRGAMVTTSISDFVRYSLQNQGVGVYCFIDADEMQAVTTFNIGTLLCPGHADNTASVALKKTAPFRALLDIDGRKNRQKELAEWLEDWREYLLAFDVDGNVMDIRHAVGAVRRITIESVSSADHEDKDFSGKRSLMESVEAKSKEVMPVAFEFKCIPYEGLSERRFSLRYSILANDPPQLVLRIVQLEAEEERMATEFRDLLTSEFEGNTVETFIGKFKP